MKQELVKEWMSHDVITVTPETGMQEADRLMIEHTIRRLPVVEDGRLVGIVTYGDIRSARPSSASSLSMWEMNYLVAQTKVAEIMTTNLLTVSPEATIGEVAYIMLKNMISGVPVVDSKGALVGIITESDIFRMVVDEWMRTKDEQTEPYAHYG